MAGVKTGGSAGNLPADRTSFVGRRQATAEVKRVLSAARLVTLTGVGGVGKSRLALHVGREVRRTFPDGVWLVELAKLGDPALVEQTVAAALELRDHSRRDPATVLAEFLTDKHLLLILDNCEHVLQGCGPLVTRLLAAAPRLSVLTTSREPLGMPGEHLWPVPPLTLPPDADAQVPAHPYGAVALFEHRAAAAVPGFTPHRSNRLAVARLCRRLDGLPLAIELAAVRMRVMSVEDMLARLEDRFALLTTGSRTALPRHQTLRATVEWSFELCSEPERLLWARCSVFAGDFDLDAAERVCAGPGLAHNEVFEAVSGLLGKSVLVREECGLGVRYRVLETIRQYGRERLEETGDTAVLRRRHRDYYLDLAEQADANSGGPHQPEWAERLRVERANLFAAPAAASRSTSRPSSTNSTSHRPAPTTAECWLSCATSTHTATDRVRPRWSPLRPVPERWLDRPLWNHRCTDRRTSRPHVVRCPCFQPIDPEGANRLGSDRTA